MANPLLNVFKKIYERNTGKKKWDKVEKCGMGYHKAEIMSHWSQWEPNKWVIQRIRGDFSWW